MHYTGSYIIRLWQTTGSRSFYKYSPNEIMLGTLPTEHLRLAVETAKRILTKEKIESQLACQSSSTPFMNIRDGDNSKKVVTVDTPDRLGDSLLL